MTVQAHSQALPSYLSLAENALPLIYTATGGWMGPRKQDQLELNCGGSISSQHTK